MGARTSLTPSSLRAIHDRLLHVATTIDIDGESYWFHLAAIEHLRVSQALPRPILKQHKDLAGTTIPFQ